MKNGRRVNAKGEVLSVELLSNSPNEERVFLPYKASLERLGIAASVRTVDDLSSLLLQFEPRAIASILPFDQSVLIIWPQIVALVAATAICFGLAYVAFMRQEIRA